MKTQSKIFRLIIPCSLFFILFIAGCDTKEKEQIKSLQTDNNQLKMTNDSLQKIIDISSKDSGSLNGLIEVDTIEAYKIIKAYHPNNYKEAVKSLVLYYPQVKNLIDKYGSHFHIMIGKFDKDETYVIAVYDSKDKKFRYFVFDQKLLSSSYSDRNGVVIYYALPCRCGKACSCPPQPACICNCSC